MKKLNYYRKTSVNWAKSQTQIAKLLEDVDVQDVRFTFMQSQKQIICEFNYQSTLESKPVIMGVRTITKLKDVKDLEQEKNRAHRILFNKLKSRFIDIQEGNEEFVKVFMADLVVFDKNGLSKTMSEIVLPQYNKGLITGEQKEILMIGNS